MDNCLLILGAGGYGQLVKEIAVQTGKYAKIDFLDDRNPSACGTLEDYEVFRRQYDCAFVAMGDPQLRLQWIEKLDRSGYKLPVLIHPQAYVSPSAILERGTMVEPMAVVSTGAIVETGGLLCAGCVINHNARISPGCQIDCNAVVESYAVVPPQTKVPCGTVFERK